MKISWRYNVKEPTDTMSGIYELIMQPTGLITSDWKGVNVINLETNIFNSSSSRAGCGYIHTPCGTHAFDIDNSSGGLGYVSTAYGTHVSSIHGNSGGGCGSGCGSRGC